MTPRVIAPKWPRKLIWATPRVSHSGAQPWKKPSTIGEPATVKTNDQRRGHDKSDDLVLGHRRNAGADGEHRPGHQPAAEIAGEDHAIVGRGREN